MSSRIRTSTKLSTQFDGCSVIWMLSGLCILGSIILSTHFTLPLFILGVLLYTVPDMLGIFQVVTSETGSQSVLSFGNSVTIGTAVCVLMTTIGAIVSIPAITNTFMYLIGPLIVLDIADETLR